MPTWAQHADGVGLGHWPEKNRFTRLTWKGARNTNVPFQIVSRGHDIHRTILGEKLQPQNDLRGIHKGEELHIGRVGKSPGRFFNWSHSERIHARAVSGVWNVGKALQVTENASSMCQLRSRREASGYGQVGKIREGNHAEPAWYLRPHTLASECLLQALEELPGRQTSCLSLTSMHKF